MIERTYKDNYPTGRKHCSHCGCWRHLVDFGVARWADVDHTVARKLSSICKRCDAAQERSKHGWQARDWYRNGAPGTKQRKDYAKKLVADTRRERYARDAEYRARISEDNRIRRQGKGSIIRKTRQLKPEELLNPRPFLDWIDNHPRADMLDPEKRAILRLRSGEQAQVGIDIVDAVLTRNGDMDQVAVLYPLDEAA
jgi:hypothetical protein